MTPPVGSPGSGTERERVVAGIAPIIAAAKLTSYSFRDVEEIADYGGEVRYYLSGTGDSYTVSRASRSDAATDLAWAMTAVTAQKYLVLLLGPVARAELGLPALRLPFELGEEADGYSVVVHGEESEELLHGGAHVATFPYITGLHESVEFSHRVGSEVERLIALYLG